MGVAVDGVNPKATTPKQLTRAEAEALLKAVRKRKARASLHDFIRYAWHVLEPGAPMQDGWHIKAIADHVQWQLEERARAVADPTYTAHEVVQNLLVNIPPRCLKSRIISVCATAWAWLHWPHLRILVLSTNPRVCSRDGLASLTLIRSPFYQTLITGDDGKLEWELEKDGVQEFSNTKGGTRAAHGLGGNITGEGCDWMIVDDPHDARDTLDAIIKTCEEYDTAIGNRINDPRTSIRTGVMQRINAGDWSAAMLAQGWLHLCLPMEFELARACSTPMPVDERGHYAGTDTAGAPLTWCDPRKTPGEVLHPRFTREFLAKERLRLQEFGYAGQMQQRPAPLEGGQFKRAKLRFWRPETMSLPEVIRRPAGCVPAHEYPAEIVPCKRKTAVPEFDWITLTVDCAFKDTEDGSRVGLIILAGRGVKRYILHDHTRPLSFTETLAAIRSLVADYPGVPFTYRCTRTLVEDKANGPAVINVLNAEVSGLVEVQPEGGKRARAAAMSPTIEAGQLYILEGAAWSDELVEELCTFPNGRHDDRVDALSQAITYHAQSDDLLGLLQLCEA
jgi:predicted phage terminase large subunit-like protein